MQIRIIICSALLLAAASQANAEKLQMNMTPATLGDGFAFEMTSLENGKTHFSITRDPSKANQPTDSELTLVRGATLSVYNHAGLIAQCPVAPRRNKSEKLVYEFQLDNGHVKRSRFILSEGVDYKQGDLRYIVNGTYYSFSLIDFVDTNQSESEEDANE